LVNPAQRGRMRLLWIEWEEGAGEAMTNDRVLQRPIAGPMFELLISRLTFEGEGPVLT
jgi:hypothetical protein